MLNHFLSQIRVTEEDKREAAEGFRIDRRMRTTLRNWLLPRSEFRSSSYLPFPYSLSLCRDIFNISDSFLFNVKRPSDLAT